MTNMSNGHDVEITFRLKQKELPTIENHYTAYGFRKSAERAGLPVDHWYPSAPTPEASMLNKAFDSKGPTAAAIAMVKADKETYPSVRSIGAWNGIEGDGGIVITSLQGVDRPCVSNVDSRGIPGYLTKRLSQK